MGEWNVILIYGFIIVAVGYFITRFIFGLLLRGFSPFLPSRPWVVWQIMDGLTLGKEKVEMIAFSSGRSGVFYGLSKRYPQSTFIGVESDFFSYLVAKVQQLLRQTNIKVKFKKYRSVNIKNADLIYCHLEPNELRQLGSKFKFECKSGAIVISTGFNIPFLDPMKIIPLEDRQGKFDWLARNQNLFQSKYKKYKKEKKAYFYQI